MGGRDLAKLCGREGSGCSFRWMHDTPGSERGGRKKTIAQRGGGRKEDGKGRESRNISWGLSAYPYYP